MSDELNTGEFREEDLTIIAPLKNPVVLKSGGPIMEMVSEDDEGFCLVSWGGLNNDEKTATFPSVCLFKCVTYSEQS